MLENKEGKKVPQVTFKIRENDAWVERTTDSIFSGKKVVLFALPGAFTPTCSSAHLPRYNQLAGAFKKEGVSEIVCLSVNDTFTMNAWKADQVAENITFIPDGNGEFSKGMGMLVDKQNLGFGHRSWRYSMLVDDGVIKKMFIEPEVEGDPFEVSDADTMLKYLNPKAAREPVFLVSKPGCPYCKKAKALLSEHGYQYEEVSLGEQVSTSTVLALSSKTSVPQIFIGGKYVGGSEDLEKFLKTTAK